MTGNELRQKYIEFFIERGHIQIPAAPLVPENDPTTLFTSSGMQPLIPYLLGQTHQMGKRLVDSQPSFRAEDIDEVGDNRHTTFFEMLGNWSLGDYFKKDQLTWFFEFLTSELNLPKDKIYVSYFEGNKDVPEDTETLEYWKELGVTDDHIFPYGVKKNWWSRSGIPENMPEGEIGGPDSEVFFDFGKELDLHERSNWKDEECHPNCNCGRFLEIGNSVFIQYQKQADGSLKELEQKNVDFGGGLERLLAATHNEPDIFKTDLFSEIIKEIEEYSHKSYSDSTNRADMQVIADHVKASVFLILSGVLPSNKTQGYVLRRLLRRAAVKMHQLGGGLTALPGFSAISESVLITYDGTHGVDRKNQRENVMKIIKDEISKFGDSLDRGLKEAEKINQINGKIAFDLYQTFGFPLEITTELFSEKGQEIDQAEFKAEFEKHKELSRTASAGMFKGGLQDRNEETTKLHTATHLLHQSLRTILGDHVSQKGSNITSERLRFDFSHPEKLTDEQIRKVEDLVNEQIEKSLPVTVETIDKSEALKLGALAFFAEKYPDKVTVYSVGNFSKEICGGPHVNNTSELKHFELIKEESAGSGIRRIYAKLG